MATLLATGIGLPEASERLRVRHETARSRLKAVFLKTGATTQAPPDTDADPAEHRARARHGEPLLRNPRPTLNQSNRSAV
ncbi:hypothetical protein ACU4GD_22125 [Cupriavidus basilensis]